MTGTRGAGIDAGGSPEDTADGPEVFEARALLPRLWADPVHMPEHLALFAHRHFASRAADRIARLRAARPDDDVGELERRVVGRAVRTTTVEGALTVGPFVLLVPVAFCGALLTQARMALELGAIAGLDPADDARAADLLVLQGVHPDAASAQAALTEARRASVKPSRAKLPRGTRWRTLKRMAVMLGILPVGEHQSRFRRVLAVAGAVAFFAITLFLPILTLPLLAMAYWRSTVELGVRAISYFDRSIDRTHGPAPSRARPLRSLGTAAMILVCVAAPAVLALVVVRAHPRFFGSRLLGVVLVLFALAALASVAWSIFGLLHRRVLGPR